MHIVLLILKIIGIIVLTLLGLVLLGAVIIIWNPICYRIEGSYNEKKYAAFSVRWLFRLIVLRGKFDSDQGLSWSGRIAWIPLKRRESDGEKKKSHKEKVPKTSIGDQANEFASKSDVESKTEADRENSRTDSENKPTGSFPERSTLFERLQEKCGQIKYTFRSMCDKLKLLREKKEETAAFLRQEEHQMAIRHILRQIGQLLRKLKPKKWYVRGVVGLDDPAATGEFFGGLAIVYAWLGNGLRIIPDFEESRIDVEFLAKGKMRILTLLCIIIRLAIDRQSREFILKIKTMFS